MSETGAPQWAHHVLIVSCHPRASALGKQLLAQYTTGLEAVGLGDYEVADLYAEGFDPVFKPEDYAQFEGGALEPRLLTEQARIDRADEIVIISPLWWLSFPAMLKGWFDRVWSNGWAYEFENDPEGSLLRPRPFTFLLTTGGSARTFANRGYADALDCLIRDGILGWCGVSQSRVVLLHDSGFDEDTTASHLSFTRALGERGRLAGAPDVDPARITILQSAAHRKVTSA
jgi:NAD(P)H dehydrogenase (quinone)